MQRATAADINIGVDFFNIPYKPSSREVTTEIAKYFVPNLEAIDQTPMFGVYGKNNHITYIVATTGITMATSFQTLLGVVMSDIREASGIKTWTEKHQVIQSNGRTKLTISHENPP